MPTEVKTHLAHFVAIIDTGDEKGKILYVNPSSVRSGNPELAAGNVPHGDIALVLRDQAGEELDRVYPEVRYDACVHDEAERPGLIQHDIDVPSNLAMVELIRNGEVLDTFRPRDAASTPDIAAGLALEKPLSGTESTRSGFGAAEVEDQDGITYLIQVRPDNSRSWSTLSIGRKTPEFNIDKNQFPGARSLAVRVIQNAGFNQIIIDEREISVE